MTSAGYSPPTDNWGIEVWAKTSNLSQPGTNIFGMGNSGLSLGYNQGGSNGFDAYLPTATGTATVLVGTPYQPATTSQWVDLAVVRNSGVTTFYVNGVASGITSSTTPTLASGPYGFHLFVTYGGATSFNGVLDEAPYFSFTAGNFSTSDLQLLQTPEPGTLTLVSLAGLGLLPFLRRRK